MVRRCKYLGKFEWVETANMVVLEERKNGAWWMHQFRLRKGFMEGRDKKGNWIATGHHYEQWRRRLNLMFSPPENVTVFQAIRENGRWRGPSSTPARGE